MKQVIIKSWPGKGTFSMIKQAEIMMYEMELSIIEKYSKSKFFDYNDSWLLEMLQLQQHSKTVDHLLSVSQKLMEQH